MSEIVDYRTARRRLLKTHNAANGTAHKTLAAAGLSLAKKNTRAEPQAMTPKRQRAVKAKIMTNVITKTAKTATAPAKRSHHKAKSQGGTG